MRIRFIVLTLVLASLACTANVSVLNPVPTASPESTPSAVPESTSTAQVSAPPLEGMPNVIPDSISWIYMLDTQNGWMITNKFILRTMDGGVSWHDVTPSGASALGFGVGASFLDASRGWVLIGDPNNPVNAGILYRTMDGGIHWNSNAVPFGGGELHFLDDNNGWMMLPADIGAGNEAVKFFQSTDGGANWVLVFSNLPTDPNPNESLPHGGIKSGFTPINMQEAWVSGQTYADNVLYLYHTADGGDTWSITNYQLPFNGQAMYLTHPPVFFDSKTGLVPTMVGSEGSSTLFLKTQDGGNTWTAGAAVPGSGQYSVASQKDVFVWFGGQLSVSRDSGQTWTNLSPTPDLSANLTQFQFVDAHTGWAVTSDANSHSSLYKTIDGGQTWVTQNSVRNNMKTKLIFLLLLFTTACTFQVEVLNTPTPQPTESIAIVPSASTSTPSISTDLPSTSPPSPVFTATFSPLPVTTSQSSAIQFPSNGTWQDVPDRLTTGTSKTYSLYALKDQVMSVTIVPDQSDQGGAFSMEIKGADGSVLCPIANYSCYFWRGVLPASQQYFIKLTSQVTGNFKLHVVINPPGKANQYFDYSDPKGKFSLSYSDEFAPTHFPGAEVYKFPPQLVLQYVDTQQYVPTNLNEAYFLLGSSTDPQAVSTCTQVLSFGGPETIIGDVTVDGVSFTKSEGSGVGAGNIYEQTYYRTVHNETCYEITYFIHYGNIGNYDPGTVKEFDHTTLMQKFDQILSTLVLK